MKYKIEVNIVPQEQIRNNGLGDYFFEHGKLVFNIADTKHPLYTKLILIHELIEQTLTEAKGIKESDINIYDKRFEVLYPDSNEEPGEMHDCPYRNEHTVSEAIERILCAYLGIDFKQYNDYIIKLVD